MSEEQLKTPELPAVRYTHVVAAMIGIIILMLFAFVVVAILGFAKTYDNPNSATPIVPEDSADFAHESFLPSRDKALERLTIYGWTDASHQHAHIPIDRAMQLVLQGIHPATAAPTTQPFITPSEKPLRENGT